MNAKRNTNKIDQVRRRAAQDLKQLNIEMPDRTRRTINAISAVRGTTAKDLVLSWIEEKIKNHQSELSNFDKPRCFPSVAFSA